MTYSFRTWIATAVVGWLAFNQRDYVFAILQTIAAGFSTVKEVLKEDTTFQTGSLWLDGFLTLELYLVLIIASGFVLCELLDAWIKAWRAEKENTGVYKSKGSSDTPPRKVHWRAVKLFLLSAILIFIFIHTLRFKHRSIKLSSLKLKQELHDLQTSFKGTKSFGDHLSDGDDIKSKAYQYAYGKLPDWLVKRIPGLPHDWSRDASVWSYFRLLIDESRRNWWTRQWVMGWSAWAVFVVIETVNRNHGIWLPLSYIFLGYCTSLASMQFIFFAHLLLEPRKTLDDDGDKIGFWVPGKWWVLGLGATEAVCLVMLPKLLRWMSDAPSDAASVWNLVFGFFQLVLILAPFVVAVSDEIGESDHPSARAARKTISQAWCILSLLSAALYLWTSFSALREASPAGFFGKWGRLGWLMLWQNQYYLPREIESASWGVLEELGDNPWINALGWDVVFSVLGLCAWSIVSSANVRDMLQCTFMPWLDDIAEAMEDQIEEIQEISRQRGTQDVQETAGEYADQVKEMAKPAVRKISEKTKDLRDTALPVVDSISTRVADTVGLEENILKPMRKAISHDKRNYGAVITTIDTSKIRSTSRRTGGRGGARRSTSAARPHEASGRHSAQEGPRRGRSAGLPKGLKGGNAGRAERHPSLSSTASEVLNAAADAEAAGVTWALFVIGGLGMASAGVFGADQI